MNNFHLPEFGFYGKIVSVLLLLCIFGYCNAATIFYELPSILDNTLCCCGGLFINSFICLFVFCATAGTPLSEHSNFGPSANSIFTILDFWLTQKFKKIQKFLVQNHQFHCFELEFLRKCAAFSGSLTKIDHIVIGFPYEYYESTDSDQKPSQAWQMQMKAIRF